MSRHTTVVSAASALIVGFLALNLVLIVARPDLSVRADQISRYLTGEPHWPAVLAFLLLGAGAALLAVAVRASDDPARSTVSVLLLVYAAGVVLAGLTPPDSIPHALGAVTAFAVVPLADLRSSVRRRGVWFAAMVGSFAVWPVLGVGLGERLTVVVELAWMLLLRPRPAAPHRGAAR